MVDELQHPLNESVQEGVFRLQRTWPSLLATGFIALTLAGSELFTKNFLKPVTAVVTGAATWREIGRLWVGTATMNIVGGLVMVFLVMVAFPVLPTD